jgi:hypothetical protein
MPPVKKVFESYCNSVLVGRAGIARNRERLKPKNVTALNSSPTIIICFHFPKNTTQEIFLIQINHQPDATIFQFIILTFIYS